MILQQIRKDLDKMSEVDYFETGFGVQVICGEHTMSIQCGPHNYCNDETAELAFIRGNNFIRPPLSLYGDGAFECNDVAGYMARKEINTGLQWLIGGCLGQWTNKKQGGN